LGFSTFAGIFALVRDLDDSLPSLQSIDSNPTKNTSIIYLNISNSQTHHFPRSGLSTLAILEHKNKTFLPASLSALTAATKLGSENITALLTGSDAKSLSSQAAKLNGVKKVLVVPNNAYDNFLPENFAQLIAEAVKVGGFTHVIAAHGQFGKNTIPRVGALLDSQPIADIIEVQSEDTFVRQIYAGIILEGF